VGGPEETRERPQGTEGGEAEEVAPTPFDNPFFLPVVLIGFALWLGYDGFLNEKFIADHQQPDQLWVIAFNQWGAAVCGALAAYFSWKALRERRAAREAGRSSEPRSS
jgi:hypothetical protein